jgi:phosphoribosylcarboxyaminoimidazole (NCAIR) mutase
MDEHVLLVPIRFGRLKPIFLLAGITPGHSCLEVQSETVRVRMGWAFSAETPRASIHSAHRTDDSLWSIGVHGWRGRWIVNGAAGPMVSVMIDPPARARVLGVPVTLRELLVSVDDPDGLVTALA